VISLSFFSLIFFCNSCYEPIEGCLDINSENYEVSADRACDSCCVFPDFKLNIDQVFNAEDFSLGDTLINDIGVTFKITDYLMIFSSFSLTSVDNIFTVIDSTRVPCNSSVDNYEVNDLVSIRSSTSLLTVGKWMQAGAINNISFLLGLNDCYHDAGLSGVEEESRIASVDTLYQPSEGFKTLILEINDTLRYEFIGDSESIGISKPIIASNAPGNTLVFGMKIDFGVWLATFDPNDSVEATKTKLMQSLERAITFTE